MVDPLPRLRSLCLALPEATERVSHGAPAWFVRRMFVMSRGPDAWLAAPPGVQEALVGSDPRRFFRPPYVGVRGWVGVRLDPPDVDWDEVGELVTDAYREVAPARLVRGLPGG